MATPTPISDLPELTSIAALDIVPIHQVSSNRTKKVKYSTLKNQIGVDLDVATQAQVTTSVDTLTALISSSITTAINNLKQNDIYAVGRMYVSADGTPPNVVLGFGTWVRISNFLAGQVPGDADFGFGAGSSGGSKTHNHGGVTGGHSLTSAENGPHTHDYRDRYYIERAPGVPFTEPTPINYNSRLGGGSSDTDNTGFLYIDSTTISSGGGLAHTHPISTASHLPPYTIMNIWRRTA